MITFLLLISLLLFKPGGLTNVVFAIQMCRVTSVHPPSGALLQGTVVVEVVVVAVIGTEHHAIVRRVEFVTGVIAEVVAAESISSIAAEVISVCEAVLVGFRSNFEHVVVSIPGERRPQRGSKLVLWSIFVE